MVPVVAGPPVYELFRRHLARKCVEPHHECVVEEPPDAFPVRRTRAWAVDPQGSRGEGKGGVARGRASGAGVDVVEVAVVELREGELRGVLERVVGGDVRQAEVPVLPRKHTRPRPTPRPPLPGSPAGSWPVGGGRARRAEWAPLLQSLLPVVVRLVLPPRPRPRRPAPPPRAPPRTRISPDQPRDAGGAPPTK